MEIYCDSSDPIALKSQEDALIDALNKLSPTDVIKSEKLESCFREFFERGTTEDCLQLFSQPRRAVLSDPHPQKSSSNAVSKSVLPKLPNSGNSVQNYYLEKGIDHGRIHSLDRAIRSFVSAEALPLQSYENLWSSKGAIFAGSEPGLSRTCRLRQGRQKIEVGKSELDCAGRFCLMFSVHEVAHFSQTAEDMKLEQKPGCRRMTLALEKFAQIYKISKKDFHEDKRRSRNFFQWVFLAGPGFLLEMGPDASCWEKKLNLNEVELILEYIKTHLPERYERAKSLNGVGARAIVNGLLAYGWEFEEVKTSPTPFLKEVRKYLDKSLEVPSTTDNTKRKRVEEHHTSDQRPFPVGSQAGNQHPGSCSPIAASLPSRVIFNDVEQPTTTVTSIVNIIADTTTSNAVGNIENDSIARWMADLQSGIPNAPDSNSSQGMPSVDASMLSSLGRARCLSSTLDLGSNQELTVDPIMLMNDTSMLSSLSKASRLPSTLDLGSNQELTMDPDMLLIDESMLSSLGKASCLPSTLDLDSNQELTIDPDMLLIDESMLSSLSKACCLPNVQDSEASREDLSATRIVAQFPSAGIGNVLLAQKNSGNGLRGIDQLQNETSTHLGIIV